MGHFMGAMAVEIAYTASDDVLAVINSFERVEDVRFSPDNRRIAVAGYTKNRLLILSINIAISSSAIRITVTDPFEIESRSLKNPHGVFWVDAGTLIVASRGGDTSIFRLPEPGPNNNPLTLDPLLSLEPDRREASYTPGSTAVTKVSEHLIDILTCNNYAHQVLQTLVSIDDFSCLANSVLLECDLEIPDGIAISPDQRWLAVSNHGRHNVHVYKNTGSLNHRSKPQARLQGTNYPHGIIFSPDSNHILVADAGAPFVNIYTCKDNGWRGDMAPEKRIQVMDDATFKRGSYNPMEGGPKGIDLSADGKVLVTACQEQPLAFFDFSRELHPVNSRETRSAKMTTTIPPDLTERVMRRHLLGMSLSKLHATRQYEWKIQSMKQSPCWKMTSPIRWLSKSLRRLCKTN